MENLAAFKYPLSSVTMEGHEVEYVTQAVKAGEVSGTGSFVDRFEQGLIERIGRSYAIACTNGTVALEIALRAVGVRPGTEVLVPALTFAACANAVLNIGATPVLIDIHPDTWTIDPQLARDAVTRSTRALIAVDLLGHPADYDALSALFGGLPIIEDAAQAHGAIARGKTAGNFGMISTFSFHANKAVSCGEGGAILTDDPELAATMRLMVNHGMRKDRPYWHEIVGTNARIGNLQAAFGTAQVERWTELIEARNRVKRWYQKHYRKGSFRPQMDWAAPSNCLTSLTVQHKDSIVRQLRADRNIDARSIWTPLCDLPICESRFEYPVTRAVAATTFCLPTHAGMTEEDCKVIMTAVKAAVDQAEADAEQEGVRPV